MYVGQRLSLKGQSCTVRYIGAVADKNGEWLGVEWDDASRGKHDGTHNGTSYFTCRSRLSYIPFIQAQTLMLTRRQK
jgi:dynactin complex subunit